MTEEMHEYLRQVYKAGGNPEVLCLGCGCYLNFVTSPPVWEQCETAHCRMEQMLKEHL